MMHIQYEILINQYGQDLVDKLIILNVFNGLDTSEKKIFQTEFLFILLQSKPTPKDVIPAIKNSGLKITYTPCVLMQKNGITYGSLKKIIDLPENELCKSFILLLSLFKIAYKRRFTAEKNNPNKWWYWDLSDEANLRNIPKY